MADVGKSFTFLHDNIPSWFKNLAEIEEKVANLQNEMSKVPVSRSRLKKRTGSMESIRDLDAILEDPSDSNAPPQGRKRKTPSVLSGQGSGPSKYRSRMMIIVQYDGQIQCQFEQLVRNIGTGRNLLRKGKMAARMKALTELAGSDDDSEGENADPVMSKIGYRHRAGLSSMRPRPSTRASQGQNASSYPPPELFDTVDKALESAQGLCERAAHQSLREGDCRKELDGARNHFQEVLDTATNEVARYKLRKEKEAEKNAAEEAAKQAAKQESNGDSSPSTPQFAPMDREPKPILPVIRPTAGTASTTQIAVDIEIDEDEDEDDMDFVMPPVRLMSRA